MGIDNNNISIFTEY